jgi:glycosyltransferase involved in cell wall biosynthesis
MSKILYLQYANPAAYPPLEYSSDILAHAGFKVSFLGVHSQGSMCLKFPENLNIHLKMFQYTRPGWLQKLAYLKFVISGIFNALFLRPDWIYVSDFMAAPTGVVLSRIFGFKVIYHEHDSPSVGPEKNVLLRCMLAARKMLACHAAFCILPQDERIRLFQQDTAPSRPIIRVWNCPRLGDTLGEVMRERLPGEPLSVYFHGSINLDRVPLALIEGAARSGVPVNLRVVGYETIGSLGCCDELRKAVSAAGGQVTLEMPGAISRCELGNQMVGMHVGWINFINRSGDVNLTHMVGASNKAFDYLAAGLPLIVPTTSGWEDMFVAPCYAKSCDADDADAIAATLRWFYNHPAEASEMGRAGQQRTREDWNYEWQFAPVLERIQISLTRIKPIRR